MLERLRAHRRVANRVADAPVAGVMLQPLRIHASIGQSIAASMAQHVGMNLERQSGFDASPLNHAQDSHPAQWRTIPSCEDEKPASGDLCQGADFIGFEVPDVCPHPSSKWRGVGIRP